MKDAGLVSKGSNVTYSSLGVETRLRLNLTDLG